MSKAVSALGGVTWTDGIATVHEAPLQGMITVRGDLTSKGVIKAATGATGMQMPAQGTANCNGTKGLCWMSPDELLVLCAYGDVAQVLDGMRAALGDQHGLAVDVSDARALFRVAGKGALEVMAKLAPVDFRPSAFGHGMFRRSRLAQVPAAFWMQEDDAFHVVCFRSQAQYVFDLLKAAGQKGSEVSIF
ncbi:sarcosine oxidase subunit gamma family protein [uncultured Tateyamaria sp.]|uniref:sarcosine oxidase subunit gamma n=1 Tax=uncultured Tateyamaria sp. TaxID=455651 RepID=UPI002613FEBA|nr:sarcosine oxidase subunit gamma family protein [uncultured Tateyamaria sp.]